MTANTITRNGRLVWTDEHALIDVKVSDAEARRILAHLGELVTLVEPNVQARADIFDPVGALALFTVGWPGEYEVAGPAFEAWQAKLALDAEAGAVF